MFVDHPRTVKLFQVIFQVLVTVAPVWNDAIQNSAGTRPLGQELGLGSLVLVRALSAALAGNQGHSFVVINRIEPHSTESRLATVDPTWKQAWFWVAGGVLCVVTRYDRSQAKDVLEPVGPQTTIWVKQPAA